MAYDPKQHGEFVWDNELNIILDKRNMCEEIIGASFNKREGAFFIDIPSRKGKASIPNLLLANVNWRKMIALAAALSGTDVTVLKEGQNCTFSIQSSIMYIKFWPTNLQYW